MTLCSLFQDYDRSKDALNEVFLKETSRRSLIHEATLLKTILEQQMYVEMNNSKDSHVQSSLKQDLSKVQGEKRSLDRKISLLQTEIQNLKERALSNAQLQRENISLKNQVKKLTSQLDESKSEIGKASKQFATQRAVLESKLDNAKKNIKTLKDRTSPVKPLTGSILSPQKTSSNERINVLKKPHVNSNFSVSPFLRNRQSKQDLGSSTPVQDNRNNIKTKIFAQSTPNGNVFASPLKDAKPRRSSGLKNLVRPTNSLKAALDNPDKKNKPSLFDDDDEDDDADIFGNSVLKKAEKRDDDDDTAGKKTQPDIKKKKRKIGSTTIVEETEIDEDEKSIPLKRVKLIDKLGGMSPLKQRNKERSLFKV